MTLIITAIAAIIATAIRFGKPELGDRHSIGFLSLVYWGASLMWCVDGFSELAGGAPFIELSEQEAVADDALLGACVVVLGLAAWFVFRIIKKRLLTKAT